MRVVVVGAGIVGTSAAVRLAQRGADVTLVDAGLPGDGTTGTTFAWVGASPLELWPYFELNVAGMAAYRRMQAEWGATPWFGSTGSLKWEKTPEARARLAERVEELRRCNYSALLLSPRRVGDLEPDLALPAGVEEVAFYPDEAYVYPRLLLAHLLRVGRALGVRLRAKDRVVDFQVRGARLEGAVLASGLRLRADAVVCCCGRWTDEVTRLAGVGVPLVSAEPEGSPAVGLLALTSPLTAGIARVVTAPGLDLRPDGAGRLLLHSVDLDRTVRADTPASPPPQAASELLERARQLVPYAETARVQAATIGLRALPEDGLPVVGWASGIDGLYVVVTHSGMTIGPVLGELAAAEVAGGVSDQALEPFRPDRFAAARPAA